MNAIAKNPDDLPQTADELVRALDAMSGAIGSYTPTSSNNTWRAFSATRIAVAVVLTIGAGAMFMRAQNSRAETANAANVEPDIAPSSSLQIPVHLTH